MANANDPVLATAIAAFKHFQQGSATGNWQPYLDMLIEDYRFWYPIPGAFHGENRGRDRVAAYCQMLTESTKLTISDPHHITADSDTVALEYTVTGQVAGHPFKTKVTFFYVVQGNKIAQHREYIGDIAPFITMLATK